MDVWLVWLRDGEWGDTNLMDPAHRSREAAMAWCNENRKLAGGDPVQWAQRSSGGVVTEYYGSSSRCVIVSAYRGRKEITETRFYSFQVMRLEDG